MEHGMMPRHISMTCSSFATLCAVIIEKVCFSSDIKLIDLTCPPFWGMYFLTVFPNNDNGSILPHSLSVLLKSMRGLKNKNLENHF